MTTTKYTNCIDCPNHCTIPDPDPDDWFCDDDKAVVCTKAKNDKQDPNSRYIADHSPHRHITVACRPYRTRDESVTPSWCPRKQS